jgi:hypothetical protein
MGHFLTAVALGFDPVGAYYQAYIFDALDIWSTPAPILSPPPLPTIEEHVLDLIVGHEIIGDQQGVGQLESIPKQY